MKKLIVILAIATCAASCRVADFTIMSTKNISMTDSYTLKSRCTGHGFTLKDAVDHCIEKGNGTYIANVVIYKGAFRYKVVGDVYGK